MLRRILACCSIGFILFIVYIKENNKHEYIQLLGIVGSRIPILNKEVSSVNSFNPHCCHRVRYKHLHYLAVQASFYSNVIGWSIVTQAARLRFPGRKWEFFTSSITFSAQHKIILSPCSNFSSLITWGPCQAKKSFEHAQTQSIIRAFALCWNIL